MFPPWHGRIKRIQLRSNDGSRLCFSRIVLVVVLVIENPGEETDYEDDSGKAQDSPVITA